MTYAKLNSLLAIYLPKSKNPEIIDDFGILFMREG